MKIEELENLILELKIEKQELKLKIEKINTHLLKAQTEIKRFNAFLEEDIRNHNNGIKSLFELNRNTK